MEDTIVTIYSKPLQSDWSHAYLEKLQFIVLTTF